MVLNNIIILMLDKKISISKAISEIAQLKTENRINSSQLLYRLIDFLHKKKEMEAFWDSLIFLIDPKAIDAICFEYFMQNNVALEKLSHLELKDNQLKILATKYNEACMTLLKRLYTSSYSEDEFCEFISICTDEYSFKYILSIPKQMDHKKQKLYDVINNRNDLSKELKTIALKQYNSDILENTDNVDFIKKCYIQMEPNYLLSISKNINTPIYILEELKVIQGIKYASTIRKNSLDTIKKIT